MDDSLARLLDANANRAREGLRVMEDHARFVLDDAEMAERLKSARHRLSALCDSLPGAPLLAARNVAGDVGRELSTPQERRRSDPEAVARAAARRVAEAIRCLEEYTKCFDATRAAEFEALRYELYELEQRLIVAGPRRRALRSARLYVLIAESLCRGPWLETARAAIAGGAGVIQLREKNLPDRALLQRACELRAITREMGVLLLINDRPDIARLCDADGVHVGQDDLPVEAARRIVGRDRIVGVSTHNLGQFRAALDAHPDYIAVGPMFPTRTKPQDIIPGPALLAEATRAAAERLPIVCIGGINAENIAEIRSAGGRCIAVCEAVIAAPDAQAAAAALVAGMQA